MRLFLVSLVLLFVCASVPFLLSWVSSLPYHLRSVRPQTVGDRVGDLKRALPQRGAGAAGPGGGVDLSAVESAVSAALGAEEFAALGDGWRVRVGRPLVHRMEEQGKGHLRAGRYGQGFLQLLRLVRNVVEHPPAVTAELIGGGEAAAAAANRGSDRDRARAYLGHFVRVLPELPLAVHAGLRHLQEK